MSTIKRDQKTGKFVKAQSEKAEQELQKSPTKLIFIAQPINYEKSEEQLDEEQAEVIKFVNQLGFTVIGATDNGRKPDGIRQRILNLAAELKVIADSDAIYLMSGWEKTVTCNLEFDIAKAYGIDIFTDESGRLDEKEEPKEAQSKSEDCSIEEVIGFVWDDVVTLDNFMHKMDERLTKLEKTLVSLIINN